ncbi:MAG: integrase, partial [Proteobacteria bacterium]|nr:integrase [Pseudomonadota bacterium]
MSRDLPYVQLKIVKGRPYYYFRHEGVYQRLPGSPSETAF